MKTYGCVGLALLLVGCATSRKISQFPLRDIASVRTVPGSVEARQKFESLKFPSSCPKGIQETLPKLIVEEMETVSCPAELAPSFAESYRLVKLEDRSLLEEVISSDCHSFGSDHPEEALSNVLQINANDADTPKESLKALKESVTKILNIHLPLSKWKDSNGLYLLPVEEFEFLQNFAIEDGCKIRADDLESAYRTVRILDEAKLHIRNETTLKAIERFLESFQIVLDKHLMEYFYP